MYKISYNIVGLIYSYVSSLFAYPIIPGSNLSDNTGL